MRNMTGMPGKRNIKSTIKDAETRAAGNILHLLAVRDEETYQHALEVLEYILLETPDSADSPYHNLGILLAQAIEAYEQQHFPVPRSSGVDVLRFLMEQNRLKQSDLLPVLGARSIVSELLSGKRELNKRQIEALSAYFKVSPSVFFAEKGLA